MKTISLTLVVWVLMVAVCYGQLEGIRQGSPEWAEMMRNAGQRQQAAREAQLAKKEAEREKAAAKAAAYQRALETGRALFGADKRWMEDRSISDSWATGTVFGKSPLAYLVGDWGYTQVEFCVIGRAGKGCLVLPNVPGAQVMLLRGLDMAKVTDGVTFILQHPFVIPETYSYETVTGGRKTVLVMEVNEEKLAVELAKVGADIAAQKAAKMAAEKAKQDAEKARQDAIAAARKQVEDAKRRTWTSVDGRFTVDAKFVNAGSGVVTLKKDDGNTISVRLEELSQEDRDFVRYRKWMSGKPTPPTPEPAAPAPVGEPPTALSTVTNSIGMKLVLIPPGEFLMGSPDSDREASSDEKPQHRVRITRPFHLGVFEVTQAQYQQVMGSNPSRFKDEGGLLPAENFSWADTQEFCAKLSDLPEEKRAGRQYRLPTEAEWEYACRAGSASRYGFDESKGSLGSYAWFSENSGSKTHPVGQKKPNAWGLYDMHGNVYEWCSDWYGNYDALAVDDPRGPMAGSYRVLRGGSWDSGAWYCRSAAPRRGHTGGGRGADLGFRVAVSSVYASGR